MKTLTVGILAHVDAGKTTLSEGILYQSGSIRTAGRVDKGDAFLDTHSLEKERGITIFSKQARFEWKGLSVTLVDTPGHVDFSAEMERTLQVLDYAILVISGADGVQGHTRTLWRLLEKYGIPVFLFLNKMDQEGTETAALMSELREKLDENCVDFGIAGQAVFQEQIAMCGEDALEEFLGTGVVSAESVAGLVKRRSVFPCFSGSALRQQGIGELLDGLAAYTCPAFYPPEFGARVFKITRDGQGNRLTFFKVTGGMLRVRDSLFGMAENGEVWEEKVNQIRIYSGARFEAVTEAEAGTVCAVTGLSQTYPGEGIGAEAGFLKPVLEPVLTYQIKLPEGMDPAVLYGRLRQLEEEDPMLRLAWQEESRQIQAQVMGAVQIEVLKRLILERFQIETEFASGAIVYKETIAAPVEGVGHFEPLRHYAEVHLILEPGAPGSGMEFVSACREEILDINWQRLILTHLKERMHRGVLTGSVLTDMRITLVSGRAHPKHTEGGDFRQATYRAVRQGLMGAENILLEPYYEFVLEVPEEGVGRAMTDLENRFAVFDPPRFEGNMASLRGTVPVASLGDYQREVAAYTKGYGNLFCEVKGYGPCHNREEVIAQFHYLPEADPDNLSSSIFCSHGAGFSVPWDLVPEYMHLESCMPDRRAESQDPEETPYSSFTDRFLDTEEVDRILNRASFANQGKEGKHWKAARRTTEYPVSSVRQYTKRERKEPYLLVDGYNIIFAWEELQELAKVSIDGARGKLLDILCDYQAVRGMKLIVVFDAYRVQGHREEILNYHNIHVVYTKEAETADHYIERFTNLHGKTFEITVATSDGLEQIIIRGQGCSLFSARDLKDEVEQSRQQIRDTYLEIQSKAKTSLAEILPDETGERL